MQIKQAQYPLIKFDTIAKENRTKTMEAGRLIHDDVDIVYVKQVGEKDETEKVATEWLEQLRAQSFGLNGMAPRTDPEFYEFAKKKYDNYKAGLANRPEGFLVSEWPILSKSQVRNMHAMDTYTVEQVAAWTESAVAMYGMGARDLRDKAKLYLESGDAKTEEIFALRVENESLKTKLDNLAEEFKTMKSDMQKDKSRGQKAA